MSNGSSGGGNPPVSIPSTGVAGRMDAYTEAKRHMEELLGMQERFNNGWGGGGGPGGPRGGAGHPGGNGHPAAAGGSARGTATVVEAMAFRTMRRVPNAPTTKPKLTVPVARRRPTKKSPAAASAFSGAHEPPKPFMP